MAGNKTVTDSKSERRGNSGSFSSPRAAAQDNGIDVVTYIDEAIEALRRQRENAIAINRAISGSERRAA